PQMEMGSCVSCSPKLRALFCKKAICCSRYRCFVILQSFVHIVLSVLEEPIDEASQVQIGWPSRRKIVRGAHARRMRIAMARVAAVDNRLRPISTGVERQSARASGRQAGGDPVGR